MNKLTSEQIEAVMKALEKFKELRHSYFITDDELRTALSSVGVEECKPKSKPPRCKECGYPLGLCRCNVFTIKL